MSTTSVEQTSEQTSKDTLMHKYLIKKQTKKVRWTKEEDAALLDSVRRNGETNWSKVVLDIPNRTKKQCREHYINSLSTLISKDPFTAEEDKIILQMQKDIGNHWVLISKELYGRTPNAVKNRYCSHLSKIKHNMNKHEQACTKIRSIVLKSLGTKSAFVPVEKEMFEIFNYNTVSRKTLSWAFWSMKTGKYRDHVQNIKKSSFQFFSQFFQFLPNSWGFKQLFVYKLIKKQLW
ncbi:hypothetical protein EIN_276810 [Entamoeba invadens IP1]|uniref:Myb-like DNA-binding domain containing protein n=1 Tax=Entamoeba invadens IP1 TaxID=370355 RepID=A0A0A1TVF0_ENTIV|nr:hypothetical protein EIN_276810 [Entamoeba invadens IP1]ELP84331.1 hypothetical protein EIN_276810 [Entamoeba invadens IP1]|eukprot:XP_004183677.1 hypothetical protein EIN_276810 [Entamoeba invadens IP1]